MFDLIVKGGSLPDGRVTDIGITGDKITAIANLGAVSYTHLTLPTN